MNSIAVIRWKKRKATRQIREKTGKQRKKKGGKKQEKTEKNNEQQNHQNWLAIFILAGCYYFDPGVGDLYFGVFFLRCEHYIYIYIYI